MVRIPSFGQRTLHALAGPYALDALDAAERARFERHLRTCEACQSEVRGFSATAAQLGLAAFEQPSPQLKGRVLAAVASLGSAQAIDREIAALLADPEARTTTASTTTGGHATVVASRRSGAMVFTSFGLRALTPEEVYELWFIGDAGIRPAGLVSDATGGSTAAVYASGLLLGDRVGITVEPAGGSPAPTTTPIVVMELAA